MAISARTLKINFRNTAFELLYYLNEALYEYKHRKDNNRLLRRLQNIMGLLSENGRIFRCPEISRFAGALEEVYTEMFETGDTMCEESIRLTQTAGDTILSIAIAFTDEAPIEESYSSNQDAILASLRRHTTAQAPMLLPSGMSMQPSGVI